MKVLSDKLVPGERLPHHRPRGFEVGAEPCQEQLYCLGVLEVPGNLANGWATPTTTMMQQKSRNV